jgi:hypothetical protein
MPRKNPSLPRLRQGAVLTVIASEATGVLAGILSFATANPLVAPVITAIRLAINVRYGTRLDEERARRVLDAALADPDRTLLEITFGTKLHPDAQQLQRELRKRLHDIADVVDDGAAEVLIRILGLRLKKQVTLREAQELVELVKPLDEREIRDLRRLLRETLKVSPDPFVGLISWFDRKDGSPPTTSVGVGVGSQASWVPVTDCPSTLRLFKLLRVSELGVTRNIVASLDVIGGRPQEAISILRQNAERILRVL